MKKRLVSLLLTLALLVLPVVSAGADQPEPTLVQTQTETAEAAQHQYSYIALGDSIVAGIGLPDAVYQRNGRYYDVSGNYQGYSKDCYVARVAEGLGLSRDQTANYGMPALMSGDPVRIIRAYLLDLYHAYPDIQIVGSAVTGYGEKLMQTAFGVEHGIVETLAHYTAAKKFRPDVDFIIDIGGQDIKCFQIKNGLIDSLYLNEACSSGCCSFLQTFADTLGLTSAEFAKLGLFADAPADLVSAET